jgi:hypothetical protein
MHDHDLEIEIADPAAARHREQADAVSGRDIGRGVEARRPDALGPGGMLHLQRSAGNAGVAGLVASRQAEGEGEDTSPVHDVVASRGTPLDPGTRFDMESAVGHDFGDVEVHTDAQAAASARAVQAHAYTVGSHIVFGEGRYHPETDEGRRTLAHELTHVVQQREGPVDGTRAPAGNRVSDPSDRFEREADNVADRVMSGDGGPGSDMPPAGSRAVPIQLEADLAPGIELPVQRQAAEEEEAEEPAGAVPAEGPSVAPEEETEEELPVSTLSVQRQGESDEEETEEELPVSTLSVQRQGESEEEEEESVTQD